MDVQRPANDASRDMFNVRNMRLMHFTLLIGIVSFIRSVPSYLIFLSDAQIRFSPRAIAKTLLWEGLAAKSLKTPGNGSFLSYR